MTQSHTVSPGGTPPSVSTSTGAASPASADASGGALAGASSGLSLASSPGSSGRAGLPLVRRDILSFEHILRDDLARLLPFEAHALYFPTVDEVPGPVWIAEEEKLLLPLRRDGALLGVLLLRRPDPATLGTLLDHLPGIVSLCLDKLALYKWGRMDALTGLAVRAVLLERLAQEMVHVRRVFAAGQAHEPDSGLEPDARNESGADAQTDSGDELPVPTSPDSDISEIFSIKAKSSSYLAALSVTVLRLTGLRAVSRIHGHGTAERLIQALSAALSNILPDEALSARTGDSEFTVLLPGGVRGSTEEAASHWVRTLNAVRLASPLTGVGVRAVAHAGYTLFPQDWEAGREGREAGEMDGEAESLFEKARLAAYRAGDVAGAEDGVLGYGSILLKGGVIERILPLSRVYTSLGRDVGAREGQRFSVWSLNYPVQGREYASDLNMEPLDPLYKGEVVLIDVREDSSQAEILLMGDPAWLLEPGDHMTMLSEDYGTITSETDRPGRPDPLTGLYRHGEFLARLAVARERYSAFGLVLFRFPPLSGSGTKPVGMEHNMAEAVALLRSLLKDRADCAWVAHAPSADVGASLPSGQAPEQEAAGVARPDAELLAGRYSLNSLLLFHPGLTAADALSIYTSIGSELARILGFPVATGIACMPWLSYRASDALECCRKALDYALLLPEPHVGVFDSLAINISADKRYSQGDVFGAMEEYRLALLADERNTLAWNSLGVCLAGVGRHDEARRAFEEAVRRHPDDPAGHYNLGTANVTLGETDRAAEQFQACLDLDPNHLFACIRLGELAEAKNHMEEAQLYYERGLKAYPDSPLPYRCLARLETREHHPDKAREHLHQSLQRNPQDAFSLHLMARMYLDGGEDPELAETLARQSLALRPDRKAAWLELARALEAQGRHRDARDARVKAGDL